MMIIHLLLCDAIKCLYTTLLSTLSFQCFTMKIRAMIESKNMAAVNELTIKLSSTWKKGGIVWWWGVPLPTSLIIKLWTFLYWKTSFVFITLCFSNDERWDYLNEELYFEVEMYKPPKLFYQFGGWYFNFIFLNQPTRIPVEQTSLINSSFFPP